MHPACATDSYAAASLRHDGNKRFSAKEYTVAVEAYTEGKGREAREDWQRQTIKLRLAVFFQLYGSTIQTPSSGAIERLQGWPSVIRAWPSRTLCKEQGK